MSRTTREAMVERLAVAMAGGATLRASCRALGVPERTGKAWAARDEFKARVRELSAQINARSVARLSRLVLKSVGKLDAVLDDPSAGGELIVKTFAAAVDRFIALDAHFSARRGATPDAPRLVIPGFDPRWQERPGTEPEPEGGAPPCPTTPG